jgi:ribosomal protein L11 methyltransferase
MPWLQLTVTAARDQADKVEGLFKSLGALSVSYGDAADQLLLEPSPWETRLWQLSRVSALFAGDADADLLCAAVRSGLPPALADTLGRQTLADQVWERVWLADFRPMRFGRRLWVCPAGQRPEQRDAVVVDLDPGLAFGTGTHPTTALCLTWLDGAVLTGRRVLDYGCGSGILAIAAARLGAADVTAVDHDPQALEATRDNATKNGVAARLEVLAPEQCPRLQYDCVLANILAGTLVELATLLGSRVRPGGQLVLSGILRDQAGQVAAAYGDRFDLTPARHQEEWVLLHGVRRRD